MKKADPTAIVEVNAPDRGLVSRFPTNVTGKSQKNSIVKGSNIRAEDKMLRNSPGYERVASKGSILDSSINKIFQANIINQNAETQTAPLIGTGSKVFALLRRSEVLSCPIDSRRCKVRIAFVGNTGELATGDASTQAISQVAARIARYSPDYVVLLGNNISTCSGADPTNESPYETLVAQFYGQYVEGYSGKYGQGSSTQRLFSAIGPNDYADTGLLWSDFFRFPGVSEQYYSVKLGPVELFVLNSENIGSQLSWLTAGLANTDAEWPIVALYDSPYSSVNPTGALQSWNFEALGAKAVISAGARNYERLKRSGGTIPYIVSGAGGISSLQTNTAITESQFLYSADYGAVILDADFSVLATQFVTKSGVSMDSFTSVTPHVGSGICYLPDTPSTRSTITKLVVEPPHIDLEIGESWDFSATAYYPDGTFEDVTEKSDWSSAAPAIASIASGRALGVSFPVSPATNPTTVTASYLGVSGTATIDVVARCTPPQRDIVLVVERSTSMGDASGDKTKFDYAIQFVKRFSERLKDSDRLALVTFAGDYALQIPDVTLDSDFTDDFVAVSDKMASLSPAGGCATAAALEAANGLFDDARDDTDKIIILVTDGEADIVLNGSSANRTDAITAAMRAVDEWVADFKVAAENAAPVDTSFAVVGYNTEALSDETQQKILQWGTWGYFPVNYHTFVPLVLTLLTSSCAVPGTSIKPNPSKYPSTYGVPYAHSEVPAATLLAYFAPYFSYMWEALQYEAAIEHPGVPFASFEYVLGTRSAPDYQSVVSLAAKWAAAGGGTAPLQPGGPLKYPFNRLEDPPNDWDVVDYPGTPDTGFLVNTLSWVSLQGVPGFAVGEVRPGLDYGAFVKWDVIDGSVDLCGPGLYNVMSQSGFYVDLCGSGGGNRFEGTMRSKVGHDVTYTAGQPYRVRVRLAGPNRVGCLPGMSVSISIGSLFGATVSFDTESDLESPFTEYSWDFIAPATATTGITVRMNPLPEGSPSAYGIWMDDLSIHLLAVNPGEETTEDDTLFEDEFGDEDPLPS